MGPEPLLCPITVCVGWGQSFCLDLLLQGIRTRCRTLASRHPPWNPPGQSLSAQYHPGEYPQVSTTQ
ncbi:hypothetical protein NHX12_008769, partial [Muraenolepis orangiensis]